MASVSLSCYHCDNDLGDISMYQIYEKFPKWYKLIVKLNKRDIFLAKLATLDNQSFIKCGFCKLNIGQEKNIGPKMEPILCLFTDKNFNKDCKWDQLLKEYPGIKLCDNNNFYQDDNDLSLHEANKGSNFRSIDQLFKVNNITCNFTIQAYFYHKKSSNDELSGLLQNIQLKTSYLKKIEQCAAASTYISNEIDNYDNYNLHFEIDEYYEENFDAEEVFAFDTIKTLLDRDIKNQAFIWQQQKKETQINEPPANLSLYCANVEFGNLKSPFIFIKSNMFNCLAKFNILFDSKYIIIFIVCHDTFYKIEIEFNNVDNFICLKENDENFSAYIPLKRLFTVYGYKNNNKGHVKQDIDLFDIENDLSRDSDFVKTKLKYISKNEAKLNWEKVLLRNPELTIKLIFNTQDKSEVVKSFQKICFNRIFFSNVSSIECSNTMEDLRLEFQWKDFETKYYLECLISQHYSILNGKVTKKFVKILLDAEPHEFRYIIKNLCIRLGSYRFLSLDKLAETIKSQMRLDKINELNQNKNKNILNIKNAIITPTRVIYYVPVPNVTNRVLRKFNHENFLRVRIRSDDFAKLNRSCDFTDMKTIYDDISRKLREGIMLYDHTFEFLAMSSSQMRDHGCWMYASDDTISNVTVDSIREWMGNFNQIRCIGKYAARLGQSLSCSIETIETKNFKIIKDIERDGYCFTDGIGQISKNKAEEISKSYFNSNYISVFQIRFAGYKGVVSINPDINDELVFRPSMKKFESSNNRLDVLNKAEFIPCHLNRQVITILTSLGIDDEVFSKFQDSMLQRLNRILIDDNVARHYIRQFFKNHYSFGMDNMLSVGSFEYTNEPFFRELLKLIYNSQLSGLINKSRIFIEKGRILIGVIDEYGLLKENEVFIQCSKECFATDSFKFSKETIQSGRDDFFIVNTSVAVAKNPCMHPGDIRVLNAVYVKKLEHLTNCIVFPCTGKRPITNMCSGSDLDGGKYFYLYQK